jgi:hypothetical protein
VTSRERLGPDLIDVVAARRLVPDDLAGALDGDGVVDAVPLVTDPRLVMVPRPARG